MPLTRPRTAADNATPSGNGIMAEVLARLYHLTGDTTWRTRAEAVLRAFSGQPDQMSGMPTLLAAADLLEAGGTVVVAGDLAGPSGRALLRAALSAADPATVVLRAADPGTLPRTHPAYGKGAGASPGGGVCLPWKCVRFACCRRRCAGTSIAQPGRPAADAIVAHFNRGTKPPTRRLVFVPIPRESSRCFMDTSQPSSRRQHSGHRRGG